MSTQRIICQVIFVLTCVGYMTGVWSLATVAMTSISALALTGCLTAKEAVGYFSNNNVIMIGAVLMVICGVLKPKEAGKAIPVSMLLLVVGALTDPERQITADGCLIIYYRNN